MTTYTINKEFNGIEITFDSKPAAEIRDTLKANGFRWHKMKGLWYAKQTEEREQLAQLLANGEKVEAKEAPKKEAGNKYGVKVGDIFYSSWGYDQTNTDFFQVVALAGASSVRVVEVAPPIIEEDAISGMSADYTYSISGEMLEPLDRSVFIKDQKAGDLKRLKSYAADGVSEPQFKLDTFANAYKVSSDKITLYNSWYA